MYAAFGLGAKEGEALLESCFKAILNMYFDPMGRRYAPRFQLTVEFWYWVLSEMKYSGFGAASPDCPAKAEAVESILLRSGVPPENIKSAYKKLTVTLDNGRYRIYRGTSGFPEGTFVMMECVNNPIRHGCDVPELSPEAIADFLLAFDALRPHLKEKEATLQQRLREWKFERQREEKSREIMHAAIDALLEQHLKPLDIGYTYEIEENETVVVKMNQHFAGEIKVLLKDLQTAFSSPELSDPF